MRARRIALDAVFALLALQGAVSLGLRVAGGAGDRWHPALHLATGLLGLAMSFRERPQRLYGALFGAAYLALGLAGALGRVRIEALPLGPADHAFHVGLGLAVTALALWGGGKPKKRPGWPKRRPKPKR